MNLEIVSIALIFIISYILIVKRFDIAVLVLFVLSVLLHKELFSFFIWDLMPIRAFMFSLLAAGVATLVYLLFIKKDIAKVKELLNDPVLILLILLWAIRGLSIFFSWNLKSSVLLYGFFSTVVVLAVYLKNFYSERQELILKHLKFYIVIVFLLTLFGYFQYFLYETTGKIIGALWNIPGNIPRIGSTFWDVNHYGSLLAALLPIACVLVLTERKVKSKLFFAVVSVSFVVSLLLTNSRTAWIIDAVALIVFVSLFLYRKIGLKGIGLVILSLILMSTPLVIEYMNKASPFRAKVKQYFHYRLDSFDSHILLLTGTYQIFEAYPILGGGYGGFFEHFNKTKIAPVYFSRDPAGLNTRVPAHTIWGELIAETGILGLSTYALLIFVLSAVLLYGALHGQTLEKSLLSTAMFSVLIGWMIGGIFYSFNSEFFWIVIVLFYLYGLNVVKSQSSLREVLSVFIRSNKLAVITILIISVTLIGIGLNSTHLIPWDEAIYSKIAKNMITTGDYITQRWWTDKEWYEKPALYMWMAAGSMKLLGYTSLAVRLPSAIFGILTIVFTYIFAKRIFNKTSAFLAALSIATTAQFLYYSRASMLDVTCGFFILTALYLYYCWKPSRAWVAYLISGLFMGLAVMTKGVVGFIPFAVVFVFELVQIIINKKFDRSAVNGLLIFLLGSLAIALPWHIRMYQLYGVSFVDNYIGYHVFDRAFSAIEDKGRPFYWYLIVLKVSMRVWFVILIPSLVYLFYKIVKYKERVSIFLAVWLIFVFTFFSAAQSKLVWYITPIYPVAAIIIGRFITDSMSWFFRRYPKYDSVVVKALLIYVITVSSLFYLFLNRKLVYTSDLTGSQARLMVHKDKVFGTKEQVFLDRIEVPLALFYTDSPFTIIDFVPDVGSRVPEVAKETERLILVTKKGRYSEKVEGYGYKPIVIKEDGDWVLWYLPSELEAAGKIPGVKF
ncbi:hypothetical protein A2619_04740 [candidate division WWE3 bacterium RIFOXYD1_FULL_39_9]|uniref:Uncharacterized protein n=1 Tax=candidate division WWE3 bacterium RIFOXYD1_FULL_39_9 TaxID=1802649 RepID=A0A1F4X6J0_UNCKA|nr:MAG: hypothetical protein A2619_04740 [candidate division WWE3 bacterium RIFOXYD1_FULL_39_9]